MSSRNKWLPGVAGVVAAVVLLFVAWFVRPHRRPTPAEFRASLPADQRAILESLHHDHIDVYPSSEVGREKELNVFSLDGAKGTDDHLRLLAAFPAISLIQLDSTFVTDEGLRHLADLKLLKSLGLPYGRLRGDGLRYLVGLEKLEFLVLRFSTIEGCLEHLSGLKKLQSLDLTGSRVARGYRHLPGSLNWLMLGETPIGDEGLAEVGQVGSLRGMELGGTRITSAGLAQLTKLNRLSSLTAGRTRVDDQGVRALATLPELNSIEVPQTEVTGTGFEAFVSRTGKAMQLINLRGCPLTREGLKTLARLPGLYSLDLSETPIADGWLSHLYECDDLTILKLERTTISADAVRLLHEKLPKCRVAWTSRR